MFMENKLIKPGKKFGFVSGMRLVLMALILCQLFASCARKNEITPLVDARSFVDQYGDGETVTLTLRFPLTEDSIDTFDSADVTNVDSPVLGGVLSGFKKLFYSMGTSFGLGKTKLRIQQVIPEIDPDLFKEMRIKKVFFTIDDTICDSPDIDYETNELCDRKKPGFFKNIINLSKEEKSSFDFVKNTVVQIKALEEIPLEDTIITYPKFKYSSFKDLLAKTFPTYFDEDLVDIERSPTFIARLFSKKPKEVEACYASGFYWNIKKAKCKKLKPKKKNLHKYYYDRVKDPRKPKHGYENTASPSQLIAEDEIEDEDQDYQDSSHTIKKEKFRTIGKYYRSKKGVVVGEDQRDIIILKTNDSFALKNFIKYNEIYNKNVLTITSIRNMLFIKVKNINKDYHLFTEVLLRDIDSKRDDIRISQVTSCLISDCISLNINPINLVPVLKGKNSVMIDVFIDVKNVPSKSFQLKGYVEFEVKVKLEI
jgi:hypothetical protein